MHVGKGIIDCHTLKSSAATVPNINHVYASETLNSFAWRQELFRRGAQQQLCREVGVPAVFNIPYSNSRLFSAFEFMSSHMGARRSQWQEEPRDETNQYA